jgi:hypothetical protein
VVGTEYRPFDEKKIVGEIMGKGEGGRGNGALD